MISETSSIPFSFFLTLPTDAAFPFLKTGGDFLGTKTGKKIFQTR